MKQKLAFPLVLQDRDNSYINLLTTLILRLICCFNGN